MKKFIAFVILALASVCASAQTTTYTTTSDGCGAKNLGYCTLPVHDQAGQTLQLTLDARYASFGQINKLYISYPYPGSEIFEVHGAYSGFVADPTWDKKIHHTGAGAFVSDDETVRGFFTFDAYYVPTCSGRGCAGVVVGWHYKVLSGSTVTVQ